MRRKLMIMELLNQQKVAQFKHHRESELDTLVESIHHVNTVTARLSEAERAITLRPFLRACFINALSVTAISQRLMDLPGEVPHDPSLVPRQANSAGEDMDNLVNLITSTVMISDLFPVLGFLDSIFRQPLKKRIRRTFASMDAFLQQVVEQRRHLPREESARDVLDILLSFRYTDEEGHEQPLTDTAVKANVQVTYNSSLKDVAPGLVFMTTFLQLASILKSLSLSLYAQGHDPGRFGYHKHDCGVAAGGIDAQSRLHRQDAKGDGHGGGQASNSGGSGSTQAALR